MRGRRRVSDGRWCGTLCEPRSTFLEGCEAIGVEVNDGGRRYAVKESVVDDHVLHSPVS